LLLTANAFFTAFRTFLLTLIWAQEYNRILAYHLQTGNPPFSDASYMPHKQDRQLSDVNLSHLSV